MRLHLRIPDGWRRELDAHGREVARGPDVSVAWGALTLLPDEQRPWIARTLRLDTAPGTHVEIAGDTLTETDDGWPLRLVEASVHATPGAPPVAWRLVAFYAFLEHAAVAIATAPDHAALVAQRATITAMLRAGRPDWTGEVAALAELFDVHPPRPVSPARAPIAVAPSTVLADAVARASLATVDAELAQAPTAGGHARRAQLLVRLGEREAARDAFAAALALAPDRAEALRGLALLHADAGRGADAIALWERAAAADPVDADALYNAGIAHASAGDHAAALAAWTRAAMRAPEDFWIARKLVQAHLALDDHAAAQAARARVRALWASSAERAVRMQDEYVLEQLRVAGATVHAVETLRPRDATAYAVLAFRVVAAGAPLAVLIETSDYAKERGSPYVIALLDAGRYRALGTAEQLPPYPQLRASVIALLADALARRG